MPTQELKRKVAPIEGPEITEKQIDEILIPELSEDKFTIAGKRFRIRVLAWRWERQFRYVVMPILQREVKPFEKAIYSVSTENHLRTGDIGITEAAFESEREVDLYLNQAVAVICLSQDPEIMSLLAAGQELPTDVETKKLRQYQAMIDNADDMRPSPRVFLRAVVQKQMEKHEMVQRLGESLMARFDEFARLAGIAPNLSGLKQAFMQQARSYLDSAGQAVSTLGNSSTPATGASFETTSKTIQTAEEIASPEMQADEASDSESQLEKSTAASASGQTSE